MKRYLLLIAAMGLLCFGIGMAWGVWTHKKKVQDMARSQPLRVLCAEKWISNETLEKFSREHNVRVQLWTYSRPSEFLRQMANADGAVDVICTSSLLLKSLVRSHWLKKMDFQNLPNAHLLAVDFSHMPFDPDGEYSVPAFWNVYGFFGRGQPPSESAWKHITQMKKIAFWGDELSVLGLMNRLGLNVEQRLEEESESKASRAMKEDIQHFAKSGIHFIKPSVEPLSASVIDGASLDWAEVPLARVAKFLSENQKYGFWLPTDGATVEMGVFAVGEKSTHSDLAMKLINELLSTDEARLMHQRLQSGTVHASLSGLAEVPPMQKAEALRQFPLNRLVFPDMSLEALPKFQKFFDESIAVKY